MSNLQLPNLERIRGWIARRSIAIDFGRSRIKLLLAEERLGKLQILQHQIIDLHEEGLISPDEINQHLHSAVHAMGNHPVVLVIPQHQTISQTIELPASEEKSIQDLIGEETVRLSGLSDSVILYDYYRLTPHGKHKNSIWVTVTRERDIQDHLKRFGTHGVTVGEITSSANAMAISYLANPLNPDQGVLCDIGAAGTTLAIIQNRQLVFATSFPIGGESFTDSIANARRCSFEDAEQIKKTRNLFQGEDHMYVFTDVVDAWLRDFEKTVREWVEDNNTDSTQPAPIQVFLTGGNSRQLGLVPYLHSKSIFEFASWPEPEETPALMQADFAVAAGALTGTFYPGGRFCSLLPEELKSNRQRMHQLLLLSKGALVLVVILFVLMTGSMAHKWMLMDKKRALIQEAVLTCQQAQRIDTLNQRREDEFLRLLPIVQKQKNTLETLRVLQILQDVREKKDLWFVLFADQPSYFAASSLTPGILKGATNDILSLATNTNSPNGFIIEVSIPDKGEERLKPLNDLVTDFKKHPYFRRVDSLPANQRTNLVDPKLILADRDYVISLDLADSVFQRTLSAIVNRSNSPPVKPAS